MREPPVATCRPYPGIAQLLRRPRQGDALQILPPKARREPHRVLEVRTGRGAHHPKTVFPRLCRHLHLSQDLSRDISHAKPRHLQSRTGRTSGNRRKTLAPNGKTRFAPAPFSRSRRMSKRNRVLTVICSMKRAKARRHTGPARPDAYVETSRGLAKRKS